MRRPENIFIGDYLVMGTFKILFMGAAGIEWTRRLFDANPTFGNEQITSLLLPEEQTTPRALSLHVQRARYLKITENPSPFHDLKEQRSYGLMHCLLSEVQTTADQQARRRHPRTMSFSETLGAVATPRFNQHNEFLTPWIVYCAINQAEQAFELVNLETAARFDTPTPGSIERA